MLDDDSKEVIARIRAEIDDLEKATTRKIQALKRMIALEMGEVKPGPKEVTIKSRWGTRTVKAGKL
jgi:hypothetical protein